MKNTALLVVAFIASAHFSYSQSNDSIKTIDSIKATRGKVTTELNVNLFQGNLNLNNALQQIKVRYFLSDNLALRVGFNFNSSKNDSDVSNAYGTNPYKYQSNRTTSTFSLNTGIEKHFRGTKRLSPYVGAELSIVSKSSSQEYGDATFTTKIDGAWQVGGNNGLYSYDERAYFRYGMNLICGFDYYFAKNFYVGYEFLFQFNKTKYKDIDVTYTSTQTQNPSTPTPTPKYKDSDSFVGPTLINGIRLGFIF